MKMVFFHDSRFKYNKKNEYYTSGGLTKEYLQGYQKYFENVTIVARKEKIDDDKITDKLSLSSAKNIDFDCVNKLGFKSLFWGENSKKIKTQIEKNDFVIIRMPSFIGIKACMECNRQKKDYIIEMVACPFDSLWNYGKFLYKPIALGVTLINKILIKKAKNVIYVSNEFLQSRYPNYKNNVGISDVKIGKVVDEILQKRLKKIDTYNKKTVYKFGLIGSLKVNFKGHETAIKALALLKDEINFELHFLGNGSDSDKQKWKQLASKYKIEEKVFFDGVLPGGEPVYNWMDNIDIYLIPSLQEGLPRALVEAMSRASVCIGVKTGGIPELLNKEMIVGRKKYKEMSQVIRKVIHDKNKLKKFAQVNFEKSKEYQEELLTEKRNQYYEKILEEIK